MDTITIIGICASIFTGISALPQLIKIFREKRAEGISVAMLIVLCTGLALWVGYGFLKEDWIIVASNGFSFVVNLLTMILSLKYKE